MGEKIKKDEDLTHSDIDNMLFPEEAVINSPESEAVHVNPIRKKRLKWPRGGRKAESRKIEQIYEADFWDGYNDNELQAKLEAIRTRIAKKQQGELIANFAKRWNYYEIDWLEKVANSIEIEIEARKARNPEP